MRSVPGTFDVDDLANGLASLAAEILACDVSEIDLSMEAPSPLEPGKVELGWASADEARSSSAPDIRPRQGEDPTNAQDDRPTNGTVTTQSTDDEAPASSAKRPRRDREEPRGDSSTRIARDELTDDEIDAEADAAADFLEGLLDAMDVSGDLRTDIREGIIEVEVVEADSGSLIGRRGQTLESIQEMLRSSMQRQFQRRSRVVVDVEGYRRRRLEKFLEDAESAIQDVLAGDESVRLEPMDVYERKQVHQLVATHDGLVSRSHGREPSRRIVIDRA